MKIGWRIASKKALRAIEKIGGMLTGYRGNHAHRNLIRGCMMGMAGSTA
jgi:hypothetical protein